MITWITGYSNSGKTSLAKQFQKENENVILLDGDQVRSRIQDGTYDMFIENLAYFSKILDDQKFNVVIAARVMDNFKERVTEICDPEWIEL